MNFIELAADTAAILVIAFFKLLFFLLMVLPLVLVFWISINISLWYYILLIPYVWLVIFVLKFFFGDKENLEEVKI